MNVQVNVQTHDEQSSVVAAGTPGTKAFYDSVGWDRQDESGDRPVDQHLFGHKETGPIREALHELLRRRVTKTIDSAGRPVNLLECGCGGNPAIYLFPSCQSYTGVDFAEPGLKLAEERIRAASVNPASAGVSSFDADLPVSLRVADITNLPFEDGQFDAVISSHVIYHIADPDAQARAISEMVRVLRPGGTFALVTANPRPLAFPGRLISRVVADLPGIGDLARKMRGNGPVPYRPLPLSWVRRRLRPHGTVSITTAGMPTTRFAQNVTEKQGMGRRIWRTVQWLETGHPKLAASLGNYALVSFRKDVRSSRA